MNNVGYVNSLRHATDDIWQAILNHPFVTGISDGTLSRERFVFYLKQDYRYLIDFSRLLALAVAKADELSEMQYFAKLLETTLHLEMEMHRQVCADYAISAEELEATTAAWATSAYTDFLVRTASEGDFADIVAVLLPCALGYVEIAKHLRQEKGLPENDHYRAWIETYTSEEMDQICQWLRDKMNTLAAGTSSRDKDRWQRLYTRSAQYELEFFEMGWTMEMGFLRTSRMSER